MFVGIDLGTSSVKTILIDENQKMLSTHTENIELLNPQAGFYEQDPKTWYEATLKCFLKIKQDKPKEFFSIRSIGISGQMHGATVLDRNNNILHPCILWNDTRSMKQCIKMEKNCPQLQDTELAKNLTVRIDGEKSFERGDRVFLNPKKENMHLFNEKGMRIGQWIS